MDPEGSLSDDLIDREVTSGFDSREFWPERTINDMIKRDVVRRELNRAGKPYDDELVNYILEHAKKLFAIAATIDARPELLLETMKFFQSNDFRDSSLSAENASSGGSASDDSFSSLLCNKLTALDRKLWRSTRRTNFSKAQWKVQAPVFSTAKSNYDFKPEAILPFIETKRNIKSGAFSRVHKVSIHPDHYKDADCPVSGLVLLLLAEWKG